MTGRINNKAKDKAFRHRVLGGLSSARRSNKKQQCRCRRLIQSSSTTTTNRINNTLILTTSVLLLLTSFNTYPSSVAYAYSDREILNALYDATGGDNWKVGSTTWRDPDSSFCSWEGILCIKQGDQNHVTSISLPSNNLKGEIPMTKLLQLPFIEMINLPDNDISLPDDIVPEDIDNGVFFDDGILSGLRHLNLDGADIYDLDGIFGSGKTVTVSMPNATSLVLGDCGLYGSFPEQILELTELEELILDKNDLDGTLPDKLGSMTKLRIIDLSSNHFAGTIPNAIGQLTNLEFLDLSTNELEGYLTNRINRLSNLQTLNVGDNGFDGPILSLEKLSRLESVDFSKNEFTGYIPNDFLSSIDHEAFAIVNLAENQLTGEVPAAPFKKLPPGTFWMHDNLITGVDEDLCKSPAADGYGCNGILCPPGTYNVIGMVLQDSGGCMVCASSTFYGATKCGDGDDDDDDVSEEDGGSSSDENDLSSIMDEDDFQSHEDSSEEDYTKSEDESTDSSENDEDDFHTKSEDESTDSSENDEDDFDWRDESLDEDESSSDSSEDDLIPSIEEEDKGGKASSDDKSSDESGSDDYGNVGLLIREVLTSFYDKCGGEAWIENDGWGDDGFVSVCAWKGITCTDNNDQRTVSEIILPDNHIMGSIPEDLFKIPKLKTLNLAMNRVAISLAALDDAKNLEKLDLSETGLLSLEGIAGADNLVELDVRNTGISEEFPKEVTSLRRLERLSLEGNHFRGPIPLKLGNLKRLQYLSLRNNELSGSIPNIWFSMDALKTLDLSMNDFTGSIPASLAKCKSLQSLDLSEQGEQSEGLSGPLGDLIDLVNIEQLDLSHNSITGTIPATFLEASKAWRGIFLNANKLSGEVPPLSNGNIDISDNKLTSVALSFCENMDLYDDYGCDAVLCPMGTYNSVGRQTENSGPCKKCPMARFMGSTECASEDGSVEISSDNSNDEDDDDTLPGMSEREILERFYSATGGENWEESYNWLRNDDICSWEGIQCNGNNVIGISLPGNNLNGDVPTSIFSLSQLEILALNKNDINFCFEGIGNATSLTVLDVSETFLLHNLDGLGDAANLEELNLAGIGLMQEFPEEILALTNLKTLDLHDNGIRGGVPPFAEQPLLKELNLGNNEFTGSIPDFDLKNINTLILNGNQLTGSIPSSITKRMPKLLWLDLSHNKDEGDPVNAPGLEGSIGSLDHLPKLIHLDLSCNSFSGEIPDDFLANIDRKYFQSVDLSDNMLTGEVPNILTGVELDQITLVKNKFTGIDKRFCARSDDSVCDKIMCPPETFEKTLGRQTEEHVCRVCPDADNEYWGNTECTKLSTPSPTQSPVAVKPIEGPTSTMSEEQILDLLYSECGGPNWKTNTGWEDPSVSHCKRFGVTCSETSMGLAVTSIVLSHNNLIGIPPIELYQLQKLETLSLSHNDILFDFADIARAQSLKVLGLSNTKVINAKGIGNAKGLEELRMNGNADIFDDLLEMLTLSKLKELIIRGNPDDGPTKTGTTTGPLPTEIGNLTQLRVLSMKGMGITGEIPKEIGNLSYLKLLQLSYNNLSGSIPQELLAISGLADVDLSHQSEGLTGTLPDFAGNKELVYLDLSSNKLTGSIPPTFLETVKPAIVKKLDLSNNKLTGFIDEPIYRIVSEIKSTMVVDLTGNQFERIKNEACVSEYSCNGIVCDVGTYNDHGRQESADDVCQPCPTATSLGSTSCTVEVPTQPPTSQPVAKRPTTTRPTVEVIKTEKDILMKFFRKCKGRLWYHRENWGGSNICHYAGVKCAKKQESVEELLLGHNNIQGIPPFELFQLPNLKKLSLYGNTGVTFSFFGVEQAMKLEELHLDHTNTRELAGVEKLPDSIKRLSLSNCGFDGRFPTPILNLKNLEYLSLGENGFTGTLPRSFSKLVSLSTLIVRNNQFGGNLDGIEFPAYLKMIDLSGNNIDGTIPLTFLSEDRCLNCEYVIDLSHNLLTGKVPSVLARFEMLNIALDNNFFLGIDKEICHKLAWNDGNVRKFGCNALLCPKGTSTQGGKQVSKHHPCKPCPEAAYYGDSRCFLEKSTGLRMKIGTLVFSIGILVSIFI